MNKYIQMFMNDNNLKIGDKFTSKEMGYHNICYFDEDGTLIIDNCTGNGILVKFLLGEYKVEKLKKPWKPQQSDLYWFVNGYGEVTYSTYYNDSEDEYILDHNLVFQTEEEAEDYKWFLDKIDEYKRPFHSPNTNYFFYYDHEDREVCQEDTDFYRRQGTTYFGNKENIDKFFEEVGEERIRKYWFQAL